MRKFIAIALPATIFLLPVIASAVGIPTIVPESCQTGKPCGLCDFVTLAQNILNAAIYLSVFLATALFAWAGFKYLTAAGESGKITEAHHIFGNVAIGLVIVLAGWLIVDTIMHQLTNTSYGQSWSSGICGS